MDTAWPAVSPNPCVHPWLDGFTCAHCGLPVRTDGEPGHPGSLTLSDDAGGRMVVLHRFCHRTDYKNPACDHDVIARRAALGWATERFRAGLGTERDVSLGLRPDDLRDPALFGKYSRVRKLRCAALAIHYYADRERPARLGAAD